MEIPTQYRPTPFGSAEFSRLDESAEAAGRPATSLVGSTGAYCVNTRRLARPKQSPTGPRVADRVQGGESWGRVAALERMPLHTAPRM
jgi:hypothetical protein